MNIPLAVTPSKEAEKPPKPTSLASEKITVDESGGEPKRIVFNESMLQYQNLNSCKRVEEK